MYNDELTNELNELTIDASNKVGWPSYVMTLVFNKENLDKKSFIKSDILYDDMFDLLFNSKKEIINDLIKKVKNICGNPISIYELPNKILHKYEKESMFYFLEELYVVEYNNYYVYYMIGNNE